MRRFPKNRLAETYARLEKKSPAQVFLGVKNPGYAEICELPESRLFFKIPSESLTIVEHALARELGCQFIEREALPADEFGQTLAETISESVAQGHFRQLKILYEYQTTFDTWRKLSDVNTSVTEFDFNIIREIVRLNLPRIYNVPCLDSPPGGTIAGLEGLWRFDPGRDAVVCITGAHGSPNRDTLLYDQKTAQSLSALGPVKNPDLEFEFVKFQIKEVLASENSLLLAEEGIRENNIHWSGLWENSEAAAVRPPPPPNRKTL